MTAQLHTCPGDGCKTQVHAERLACEPCWKRLPWWLKKAVNEAWRAYRRNPADDDAARAHRAAVTRAVQWYQDHPRGYR